MKNLEKKIKQKITNDIEITLQNYTIQYNITDKYNSDIKRIPKNVLNIIDLSKSIKHVNIKYPIILNRQKERCNIEIIKVGKGCVITRSFKAKYKKFNLTPTEVGTYFSTLSNPMLIFCKILNFTNITP